MAQARFDSQWLPGPGICNIYLVGVVRSRFMLVGHWWLTVAFQIFYTRLITHAINKCFFIPVLCTITFRCIKLAVNTLCMRNSASKCSAFCRIGHSPPSYIVRTVSSFVIANFLIETMKAINQIIQNFKRLFNSIAKFYCEDHFGSRAFASRKHADYFNLQIVREAAGVQLWAVLHC